jgi:3',5'-cyclic-AMP phosphodiesterase
MTIVIAQITDTHLRLPGERTYGVDTGHCLQDAVRTIVDAPFPIDAVIITGDLADRGRADEYAHFLDLVAPIRAPLYPIPGNHDDPRALANAFGDKMELPTAGDVAYAAEIGALRIVMLDSTVAGAAHGIMSDDRLRWLDHALSAGPSQPTLIAMHHPPFRTGIHHMDAMNCRNGSALAKLLDRHKQVLGLACGHVHRSILTSFSDRVASIGPSPAYAVSLDLATDAAASFSVEPPGLHLHRWSPEDGPHGHVTTHFMPVIASPAAPGCAQG